MRPSTSALPQPATERLALRLRVKLVAVPLAAAIPELYALPAGGECPPFERGPGRPVHNIDKKGQHPIWKIINYGLGFEQAGG